MNPWLIDNVVFATAVGSAALLIFLYAVATWTAEPPRVTRRGGRLGLKYHGGSTPRQLILQTIEVYNPREGEGLNCMAMLDAIAALHDLRVILQCANTDASQALGRACVRDLGFVQNAAYSGVESQQFDGPTKGNHVRHVQQGSAYLAGQCAQAIQTWVDHCVRERIHSSHKQFHAETMA